VKIEEIDYEKGYVRLVIESEDDLWILSMYVEEDDIVSMRTLRDVSIEGSVKKRIPMKLSLKVKKIEFQSFSGRLRIRGVIIEGPETYGLKGSYHTFSVDIGSRIEIYKKEGFIDKEFFNKLLEISNRGRKALLIALDYDEYCVQLIQGQGMRVLSEGSFPMISKSDVNSITEFDTRLRDLAIEIIKYVESYDPVAIVIGSPGGLAQKLVEKINMLRKDLRIYIDSISMGGCSGVEELVRRGVVRKIFEAYSEVRAREIFEEYMRLLIKDPDKVASGVENVHILSNIGALDKIVLIDSFLRDNVEIREKILEILRNAVSKKTEFVIVSDDSEIGLKIKSIGGIIGILRLSIDINSIKNVSKS